MSSMNYFEYMINSDLSDMLLDGSIYQTVVNDVITANYSKTTQITMPKNGRIVASCGAANNNTTSLNILTITINNAYDIYKEITTSLYSEHKIITPVIKKGTTVYVQCVLNASDWNSARYGESKILIL